MGISPHVKGSFDTPTFVHRFCLASGVSPSVKLPVSEIISDLSLYPNPASQEVTARFHLAKSDVLSVDVIDILGNKVYSLYRTNYEIGDRIVTIPLKNIRPGAYIVRIQTTGNTISRSLRVE